VFVHELAEVLVIANAIRAAKSTPLHGITTKVAATPQVLPLSVVSGASTKDGSGCRDAC